MEEAAQHADHLNSTKASEKLFFGTHFVPFGLMLSEPKSCCRKIRLNEDEVMQNLSRLFQLGWQGGVQCDQSWQYLATLAKTLKSSAFLGFIEYLANFRTYSGNIYAIGQKFNTLSGQTLNK